MRSYSEDIEMEDAIHTCLMTLKEGFDGQMDEHNIEVAVVGPDRVFRTLEPEQLRDYMDEAD